MMSDELLIEQIRGAMVASVETVEPSEALVAEVLAVRGGGRQRLRSLRRLRRLRWPRLRFGTLVPLGASLGAVAVLVLALVSLGRHTPVVLHPVSRIPGNTPAHAQPIVARVAVLRRPQMAADRLAPALARTALLGFESDGGYRYWPGLDRLAGTFGTVRIYLVVFNPTFALPQRVFDLGPLAQVGAVFVTGTSKVTDGVVPATPGGGIVTGGEGDDVTGSPEDVHQADGLDVSVVPDGVTRVRWVFARAPESDRTQSAEMASVSGNLAVAPVRAGNEVLVGATWYAANGEVVNSYGAGSPAQAAGPYQRSAIQVRASDPISPALVRSFEVFRTGGTSEPIPVQDMLQSLRLIEVPGGMSINFARARFVPDAAAPISWLNGRHGVVVIPGLHGACVYEGETNIVCERATAYESVVGGELFGFFDVDPRLVYGMAPDGNRTVTALLRGGSRLTVPVIDNVYVVHAPQPITGVLLRNAAGRPVHLL
jgi:hypothetical protein